MTGMRGIGIDPTVFPVPSAGAGGTFSFALSLGDIVTVFDGVDCGVFFGLFAAN